mgnify:CR=1 FL=1
MVAIANPKERFGECGLKMENKSHIVCFNGDIMVDWGLASDSVSLYKLSFTLYCFL